MLAEREARQAADEVQRMISSARTELPKAWAKSDCREEPLTRFPGRSTF